MAANGKAQGLPNAEREALPCGVPVAYLWKYQYDARAGEVGELEGEFVGEVGPYTKLQESREKKQVDRRYLSVWQEFSYAPQADEDKGSNEGSPGSASEGVNCAE